MNQLQLVIGNKNFSSNSLRSWLLLREFGIDFTETEVALFKADTAQKLGPLSPSLKVPALLHDDIKVWDSLAICEYISETFLEGRGWPSDARKRAAARSISAELHADFQHFKRDWPMNCQIRVRMTPDERIEEEIARLDAIMYCCRRRHGDGGEYLFGRFSIVDCLMAPFVIALEAYGAELSWKSRLYCDTLLQNPHLQDWISQAQDEVDEHHWDKAV